MGQNRCARCGSGEGLSYGEGDRLAKLIFRRPKLEKGERLDPGEGIRCARVEAGLRSEEVTRELLDVALVLEDSPATRAVHARRGHRARTGW